MELPRHGGITNPQPTIDPTTVTSRGGRSSRDNAYVPGMAEGGILRARPGGTLVNIGEGGRDEAVVPLSKMAATGGPVNITINVSGADVDGLRKVTEEQIAPYLIKMIDNTRGGARAQFLKALRLKQPGAF